MIRTAKTLIPGIRKKCKLETKSDLEIHDSESKDDNLLEPKTPNTDTGTVNEYVEEIMIDDN